MKYCFVCNFVADSPLAIHSCICKRTASEHLLCYWLLQSKLACVSGMHVLRSLCTRGGQLTQLARKEHTNSAAAQSAQECRMRMYGRPERARL